MSKRPSSQIDVQTALKPVLMSVEKMRPHPENPRTHPDDQVAGLGGAFEEFGVLQIPVVDEDGMILAGEGRWLAAQREKVPKLPVIVVRGWSPEKKLAFMVSDNRWAQLGEFDQVKLRSAVQQLMTVEYNLDVVGYTLDDAQELISVGSEGLTDPEETPEPKKNPSVRVGDLWQLGIHRLLCGDCTNAGDVASLLQSEKPRLMTTDPPYGVKYNPGWREEMGIDWMGQVQRKSTHPSVKSLKSRSLGKVANDDRADWREAWALFEGDVAYVWCASLFSDVAIASLESVGLKRRVQIIWNKQHFAFSRGDYHWKHEPCWYVVREGKTSLWSGDRKQTTVWDIQNASAFHGKKDDIVSGHGTQKPIECMKRPIENNSRKGQLVYDPFVGSGTTIIAAEMTGRRCLAIDIDPVYCEVAIERWQKFTGKVATLDGVPFDEVVAARKKGRARGAKNATGNSANRKAALTTS